MQPAIADRERKAFEQVEDGLEFDVRERLACDSPVEEGNAQQSFPIHDWHCDLGAQDLKLMLHIRIRQGSGIVAPEDAAKLQQMAANAALVRQVEVVHQLLLQPYGGSGAEPAAFGGGDASIGIVPQENGGSINSEDRTNQQQEFFQ